MTRHQRRLCEPGAQPPLNPTRMRAVIQRVTSAIVTVENRLVGAIELGLLVYVGITHADGVGETAYMANKIVGLRVFADADGRFSRSVRDVGGGVDVVRHSTRPPRLTRPGRCTKDLPTRCGSVVCRCVSASSRPT